jgi:hypothetical protein
MYDHYKINQFLWDKAIVGAAAAAKCQVFCRHHLPFGKTYTGCPITHGIIKTRWGGHLTTT